MEFLIGAAVLIGAMSQRVSGFGFALVVAPVLVLLIGPFDGVMVVNICGAVSSSLVLTRVWRRVDWRQYVRIVIPALLAIIPGSIVSVLLGGPWLQIIIGVILLIALTISLVVTRADRVYATQPAAFASGSASGFMSATAGISGPPISIYGILTRWEQSSFAATLQPYFITLGATSFIVKVVADGGRLPDIDWWIWVIVIVGIVVGLTIGESLSKRVSSRAARGAVIVFSYLGGIAAIVDGVIELAAS